MGRLWTPHRATPVIGNTRAALLASFEGVDAADFLETYETPEEGDPDETWGDELED